MTRIIDANDPEKTLDTSDAPDHYDPCFCGHCGRRVGWYDTGHHDSPVLLCDSCACEPRETNTETEGLERELLDVVRQYAAEQEERHFAGKDRR